MNAKERALPLDTPWPFGEDILDTGHSPDLLSPPGTSRGCLTVALQNPRLTPPKGGGRGLLGGQTASEAECRLDSNGHFCVSVVFGFYCC